mgnify:CR=1 FL=1
MKKILLILLVIMPVVSAAQGIIAPVDFSNEKIQAYRLGDGDGISFYINNKEFVMSIDEIGKNSVRIKSFLYNKNDSRETFYMPLNGQLSYKLDFDKDNIYDLKVDLAKIESKEKAVVLFEKIEEPKSQNNNQVTGKTTLNSDIFNIKGLVITVLIVIAGLVAYFTFRRK